MAGSYFDYENDDEGFIKNYPNDENQDSGFRRDITPIPNKPGEGFDRKVPNGVMDIYRKRRQKAEDQVRATGDEIENEINQRQIERDKYKQAIAAPVQPGNWYTRLLKGGLAGLSTRQPGESIAESLGRGVGMGLGSAISKPIYQGVGKGIRDKDLTQLYQQKVGVSNEKMQDLLGKRKIANEELEQNIKNDREERLLNKGIEDVDTTREKLKQGETALEIRAKAQQAAETQGNSRIAEGIRHNKMQEQISAQRNDMTDAHYTEIERHNKAMEAKHGENGLESYLIQSIDPRGNVKPITLKVPKGEDPMDYIKQIRTTAAGKDTNNFPTKPPTATATPSQGKTPSTIENRNKTATDKLKAGASKGLQKLIKPNNEQ